MILRCVRWSLFMCMALQPAVKAQVEVNEQGYQNVLISFAPNVHNDNQLGEDIVHIVQRLLEKTSSVLQTAIGIRIASATFLLPLSWSTEKWENVTVSTASPGQMERRPDISVDDTMFSAFGRQPVAKQHGGCGVPGHQITLPIDFLSGKEEYPKGKLFAREWLKYRYGVFEENGFKYDDVYPEFYRISGRSEITIAECTESDITYKYQNEYCEKGSEGTFDLCTMEPDKVSAANVTSSLMYYNKNLPNMVHICGKDGRRHLSTVRSKQNVLCNGRSIWDVIKLSKDFNTPQQKPTDPAPNPIQFSYVQESKPRFFVLLENSENLHQKQEQIQFALRRFFYDLPAKSHLAIYTYNSNVSLLVPPIELLETRFDLATIADFTYSQGDICTSCGLELASKMMLNYPEVDKGSVLLITASSLNKMPVLSEKLKSSRLCLDVLRFHDEKDPVDKSYEALKDSFSCFSYHPLSNSLNNSLTFTSVYNFLKNPVPKLMDEDYEIKTETFEISGKDPITFPPDETAYRYTLWLAKAFGSSDSIQCQVGETEVDLSPTTKGTDISAFTFHPKDAAITCKLSSTKVPPILTQVQMRTLSGEYFVFDTWIDDMSTEKEQLPIKIYARIFYGGYPVKGANVTTIVTSEKNPAVKVTMLDNGRGEPDITDGDGVYSGVFANFLTAGDYQITVKINDQSGITRIGKEYRPLTRDTCCGSKLMSKYSDARAFEMEKQMLYTAKNKRPDEGYRPFRIVDLHMMKIPGQIFLSWSVPEGEKVERYDLKMFQSREDAIESFDTKGVELNSSAIMRGDSGETAAYILNYDDLENGTAYYVALRSWNGFNKHSEISNILEFFLPKDFPTTTASTTEASSTTGKPGGKGGKSGQSPGNKTTEIAVGVVAGIVVLCILGFLAYYFFVQKPKREAEARARQNVH